MITAYYNEFDTKAAAWLRQLIKNGNITPGEVDERSITEVCANDLVGFDRVHFFAGVGTWDYCLNKSEWGDRKIWTASLPCQPFSAAGKGLGKADERHLLPHFLKLVRECKPNRIFGEQVERAIAHGWLDDLQATMEAEGYAVGYCVLGAHSIGAPHIRQRLYWVANSIDNSSERSVRRINDQTDGSEIGNRENIAIAREFGRTSENVCGLADNLCDRSQGWLSGREDSGRKIINRSIGRDGTNDGLGISDSPGSQQGIETTEASRYGHSIESTSSFVRMGNAECDGHDASEIGRSVSEGETKSRVQQFKGSDSIEWIYCRDSKYRPVKPGIQPLADGLAGRMVCSSDSGAPINANATQEARAIRLKGYGNAIQAQTAIAFITACMSI